MLSNIDLTHAAAIATILGAIAAWIACFPLMSQFFGQILGFNNKPEVEEQTYLKSLIRDLEFRNKQNHWSNALYIPVNTQLQEFTPQQLQPKFYRVNSINPHIPDKEFGNLSNVEKIDSSKGTTYSSLDSAVKDAEDNATIVMAPPGGSKTVSLRNLAIMNATNRMNNRSSIIPIFVNLGFYTQFDDDGQIQSFESFLRSYFVSNGYCDYLTRNLRSLLMQNRCIFFLDGIDEMPRASEEYEARSRNIKDFVRQWPEIKFILSCRELDYNSELSFQQILVKPFEDYQIKKYCKLYFPKQQYKQVFQSICSNQPIFELCQNPFYLNLICLYTMATSKLPATKAQLFEFLIEQFIFRETNKSKGLDSDSVKNSFVEVMSKFAYYLAIEVRKTTVTLQSFLSQLNEQERQIAEPMLEIAVKGYLIEYIDSSDEIRFVHNRFQEFFSARVLLENYKDNNFALPKNFFTDLWWRETSLFMAGLESNVDNLILTILKTRESLSDREPVINRLLNLELLLLSFYCIFNNLTFNNPQLFKQIRDELLALYEKGTVLEQAKILEALSNDKSKENALFFEQALKSSSNWINERAFFYLSGKYLKLNMKAKNIFKEYWRFFYEGRLLETFIPTVKASLKSVKLMLFMPLYFMLIGLNILCITGIFYVFYSYFEYVAFKLDLAFTAECIQCLLTLCVSLYVILYFLINNDYPFLKKFIKVFPLALLLYYFSFYLPADLLVKFIMVSVSYFSLVLYDRYVRKPEESKYSLDRVTIGLAGLLLIVPFYLGYKDQSHLAIDIVDDKFSEVKNWMFKSDLETLLDDNLLTSDITESVVDDKGKLATTELKRNLIVVFENVAQSDAGQEVMEELSINEYELIDNVVKQLEKENFSQLSNLQLQQKINGTLISQLRNLQSQEQTPYALYLVLLLLLAAIIATVNFISLQVKGLKSLDKIDGEIDFILSARGSVMDKINSLNGILDESKDLWFKKSVVNRIKERLNFNKRLSRKDKVVFYNKMAESTSNAEYKDIFYQALENEEKNYRRTLDR